MTEVPGKLTPQLALDTACRIVQGCGANLQEVMKQPAFVIAGEVVMDIAHGQLLVPGSVAQRIAALYARCVAAEAQLLQAMQAAEVARNPALRVLQ